MQSPIFGDATTPLYLNLFIMIPVLASLVTIVLVVIVTCVCLQRIKRRPNQVPQMPQGTMDRRSKQCAVVLEGQPQSKQRRSSVGCRAACRSSESSVSP